MGSASFSVAKSPGSQGSAGSAPKLPKLARNPTDISQRKEAIQKTVESAFPDLPKEKVECRGKGCKKLISANIVGTYGYCSDCPKCPKCKKRTLFVQRKRAGDFHCPLKT